MLKKIKTVTLVMVSLLFLMIGLPAWAASVNIGQNAAVLSNDELGVRLEAPSGVSDKLLIATLEPVDYSKITPIDDFYVTRAVNLKIVNSAGWEAGYLTRPARLVFSFNGIDFKRASRLNTNLSVGYFRIGYWDVSKNYWVELPSKVFWNGSNGAVEAETDHGPGMYALLWSYKEDAQLSNLAGDGIRVMVNLTPVRSEVSPYVKDNRTMVPLRVIAENIGVQVNWDGTENRIDLVKNKDKIQLWIGKQEAMKNGKTLFLDVAPEVTEDRTFVPLRFVAEEMGAKVDWDDTTQTAEVFSN